MEIKCEVRSHGITLLLGNHKNIRKIKRKYSPSNCGHKVWPTAWLLIDYLKSLNIDSGKKIMDVGCGWGVTGIYCAKTLNAEVTSVDGDNDVYPYLEAQGEANGVKTNFINRDINNIRRKMLNNFDMVVGSDICFCDTLTEALRKFIHRAKKASVSQVLISDPGRWPFDDLVDLFKNKPWADVIDWEIETPVKTKGKILKFTF